MPFSERANFKDERRPLLRDPVWHYNYRYGRARGNDPEELEELFGRDHAKNQRFQWMLFLGVTFLSILILIGTLGILIKLSDTHPPAKPKFPTTPAPPVSKLPSTTSNPENPENSSTASTSTTPSPPSSDDITIFVSKPSTQEKT